MIGRREVLCQLGAGLVGLYGCAGLPTYMAVLKSDEIILDRIAVEKALQEREAIRVRAAGLAEDIVLIRLDSGGEGFVALGMKCSHLGCQVRPGGEFLVCPCHGSTYNLRGEVVRGPAQKSLKQYRISIVKDSITITAEMK